MIGGPSFFIAARSLLGRRRSRDALEARRKGGQERGRDELRGSTGGMAGAILGIGISLVPLILVLIVSDGMIEGITNRYMETKTYHLQVSAPDRIGRGEAERGREAMRALPGVKAAYIERNGSGVAVSAKASNAVMIRSVDPEFFVDPGVVRFLRVIEGKALPEGKREIILGSSLASVLRVKLGDSVTIITPSQEGGAAAEGGADLSGYSPKLSFFKVAGIVSAGYRDLDALWAFISPEAGDRLLTYPSAYSFFGVKVTEPYSNGLGAVKKSVIDALTPIYPDWFDPYLARTWPEIERSLYKSFGTTKSMLLFIMGIALIVAAVNLGSSLSTFVVEHSMDIAVLRSMGATDSAVRRIFVGAGLITGSLGTLLGTLLGLFLSLNVNYLVSGVEWIANLLDQALAFVRGQPAVALRLLDPEYYLEKIPVTIDMGQIALIAALGVALSAVASLIPARKASRISVQELIRKS
ncbi:MAG TPA: FtsX-like permease family protein [Rectinemataceae bacterium]|nr:FtsX-like permease family protein [Rectinemataceae bacterium]